MAVRLLFLCLNETPFKQIYGIPVGSNCALFVSVYTRLGHLLVFCAVIAIIFIRCMQNW